MIIGNEERPFLNTHIPVNVYFSGFQNLQDVCHIDLLFMERNREYLPNIHLFYIKNDKQLERDLLMYLYRTTCTGSKWSANLAVQTFFFAFCIQN